MTASPDKPVPGALSIRLQDWLASDHAGPAWLKDQRQAALADFVLAGLPTRKSEHWKYNDITPLMQPAWIIPPRPSPHMMPAATAAITPLLHADDLNIVMLNGIYHPDLSTTPDDEQVEITSLRSPLNTALLENLMSRPDPAIEMPFCLLNRAVWHDGIALSIKPATIRRRRIHLLLLHDDQVPEALLTPRVHVHAGAGSELLLSVSTASLSARRCLNIACMDIDVDEGAHLTLCQTQTLNPDSFHLGSVHVRLGRDSVLRSLDSAFGSAFSRQNMTVALAGDGADAVLNGIYAMRGTQQADFHTAIEHHRPHGRSRQVCKGILDDRSSAVFNGAVRVLPGAVATDGYQINRTLLRSPMAKVFTKPELEIANDDVRCSHGATIGQLDPQQIFYLQSRGIPAGAARDILARGFVEDLLFPLSCAHQRQELDRELDRFFNEAP